MKGIIFITAAGLCLVSSVFAEQVVKEEKNSSKGAVTKMKVTGQQRTTQVFDSRNTDEVSNNLRKRYQREAPLSNQNTRDLGRGLDQAVSINQSVGNTSTDNELVDVRLHDIINKQQFVTEEISKITGSNSETQKDIIDNF